MTMVDPFAAAGLTMEQLAAACQPRLLLEAMEYLRGLPQEDRQALWDEASERASETLEHIAENLIRHADKKAGHAAFTAIFGDVPTGKPLEDARFDKAFTKAHHIWVVIRVEQRKAQAGAD